MSFFFSFLTSNQAAHPDVSLPWRRTWNMPASSCFYANSDQDTFSRLNSDNGLLSCLTSTFAPFRFIFHIFMLQWPFKHVNQSKCSACLQPFKGFVPHSKKPESFHVLAPSCPPSHLSLPSTLTVAHGPPFFPLNMPVTFLPQDLCICCSSHLECPSYGCPQGSPPHFFQASAKYLLTAEASRSDSIHYRSPPTTCPNPPHPTVLFCSLFFSLNWNINFVKVGSLHHLFTIGFLIFRTVSGTSLLVSFNICWKIELSEIMRNCSVN